MSKSMSMDNHTSMEKMADFEEEKRPLLINSATPSAPPPCSPYPLADEQGWNVVTMPTIGVDELPPPYTASSNQGVPMIKCKVCQSMINIEGKTHKHVVKCTVCSEVTAINAAPPGKKFVRCPCNCLLICKGSSRRIACSRPNCNRIINLGPGNASITMRPPGMCRVTCVHCEDTFLFDITSKVLARCPHCRKISSAGPRYARSQSKLCCVVGLLLLELGIGLMVITYAISSKSGGIYAVYVGAFIVGFLMLIRSLYYARMKVSHIEGPDKS